MKAKKRLIRPATFVLAIAAAGFAPLAANAQSTSMADLQAQYKQDLQRCESLTDPEAKRTCRREAGAALQEARRNRLATPQADTAANAAARCQRLPADQRADCERLMTDSSAVQHGSVSGGGVLRELTITVPAGTPGATTSGNTYGSSTPSAAPSTMPAPSGYGTQPAPAPGSYGAQPSPAPSTYGTQPAR